jgi:hypothetical protein
MRIMGWLRRKTPEEKAAAKAASDARKAELRAKWDQQAPQAAGVRLGSDETCGRICNYVRGAGVLLESDRGQVRTKLNEVAVQLFDNRPRVDREKPGAVSLHGAGEYRFESRLLCSGEFVLVLGAD